MIGGIYIENKMKRFENLQTLDDNELTIITGGCKGMAYALGVIAADAALSALGFFASIAVGMDQARN